MMQFTENVHGLKIPFMIPASRKKNINRSVWVYLIYNKKITLIDSGVAGSERKIFNYIIGCTRNPDQLNLLIQTHSHPDHMGASKPIKEKTGCKIIAHKAEKPWLEDITLQYQNRPIPGFNMLVAGSVKIDQTLKGGETLDLNERKLKVIHTPGHSSGSICLYLKKEGILFSGDSILSPGMMPVYESYSESIDSLNKLKKLNNLRLILSSWDEPTEKKQIRAKLNESIQYLKQIDDAVQDLSGGELPRDWIGFTWKVLDKLNLSSNMANPLVARSLKSHLTYDE